VRLPFGLAQDGEASGSMSGVRSSQPAMQVLVSALMMPTVFIGEPILTAEGQSGMIL